MAPSGVAPDSAGNQAPLPLVAPISPPDQLTDQPTTDRRPNGSQLPAPWPQRHVSIAQNPKPNHRGANITAARMPLREPSAATAGVHPPLPAVINPQRALHNLHHLLAYHVTLKQSRPTGKPTAAWMSAKEPRAAGGGTRPSRRPCSAVCMARMDTPSSDSGYATSCVAAQGSKQQGHRGGGWAFGLGTAQADAPGSNRWAACPCDRSLPPPVGVSCVRVPLLVLSSLAAAVCHQRVHPRYPDGASIVLLN